MSTTKQQQTMLDSIVEQKVLENSPYELIYKPQEKIPSLIIEHFPALGKLAALRFLEWVQHNPGGVISLPTGKTPEYFIKWVRYFLNHWEQKAASDQLEAGGVNPSIRPDMKSLSFVQIDEFYPIHSTQENSFHHYVNKYYLKDFGLDPAKAMLINCDQIGLAKHQSLETVWPDGNVDLSLRYRQAKNHLEKTQKSVLSQIDQWCMHYENSIRQKGGIGFFLGGIGPDGHIGFNIEGSDHYSTTRLCPINYETQAAAAADMGGIEIARKSLVITIGLDTIIHNKNCTAIIIASGESKAPIVAKAIESEKTVSTPASALQQLPQARFYLTAGAAIKLTRRQSAQLENQTDISDDQVEKILVRLASEKNKKLTLLTRQDMRRDESAAIILKKRPETPSQLTALAENSLLSKISNGMQVLENTCFLHTEPHHDDVMLGYFAYVVRHFRRASNTHHFMTLTSGFTSVSNAFMLSQIENLMAFMNSPAFVKLLKQGYFDPSNQMYRNRDVWQYLDGVASRNNQIKAEGCARRMLRNLFELYDNSFRHHIHTRLKELKDYFVSQYPGSRDPQHIQRLKGMCREWEAECLWGYYGWKCDNVHHLRLGFYTGDIFTQEPTLESDVPPIVQMLNTINPDVITVAFDPESSGPDTHYKVLQTLSEAIKIYEQQTGRTDLKVWGYRNVWYRFDPSEVNLFIPVSLCMFSVIQEAFLNSFLSQKNASFPSYEHDGPFSELAQKIQVQQYQMIKTALGREWFYEHQSPLIRATRGFIFLKEMNTEQFHHSCRELKRSIEQEE